MLELQPLRRTLIPLMLAVSVTACTGTGRSSFHLMDGAPAALPGLDCCDDFRCQGHVLDPGRPATVLVHGCKSSSARFSTLRQVFEAHGQQTVCFSYDDRATIAQSANELRVALGELSRHLPGQPLTLLGHSQGGLVARAAVVDGDLNRATLPASASLRLVSVSSPFNGITAASHCGYRLVHVLSLGLTAGLCHTITGAKWFEIHPRAAPITAPGELASTVSEHVMIVTDEEGTCRRRGAEGRCIEDDFVFSLDEQINPRLVDDPRVTEITIQAGHAAIIGSENQPPLMLRDLLQEQHVLRSLSAESERKVRTLLARLY